MGKHRDLVAFAAAERSQRIVLGVIVAVVLLVAGTSWALVGRGSAPGTPQGAASPTAGVQPSVPAPPSAAAAPSSSPSARPTPSPAATRPAPEPSPTPAASPRPSSARPSPAASASPSGATTPPAVTATYLTTHTWDGGFQGAIYLANSATGPRDVVLVLTLPSGVTLGSSCWWAVDCTQQGQTLTLTATTPLAGGDDRLLGFNASRGTDGTAYEPVGCTINGAPCEGF